MATRESLELLFLVRVQVGQRNVSSTLRKAKAMSESHEEIGYHPNGLKPKTAKIHELAATILNTQGQFVELGNGLLADAATWSDEEISTDYKLIRMSLSGRQLEEFPYGQSFEFIVHEIFPDGQESITAYVFVKEHSGFLARKDKMTREQKASMEQMFADVKPDEKGVQLVTQQDQIDPEYQVDEIISLLEDAIKIKS